MVWISLITVIFVFTLYLVITLNKEKQDKYSWQKEIIYKDFIENEEILIVTSSDSFTISNFNKDNFSNAAVLSFEEKVSNLSNQPIPFKATISSYIATFLEDKNIFLGICSVNSDTIKLFNSEFKLEGPSFFIEKNIYNIYLQYKILRKDTGSFLVVENMSKYESFLNDLYKYEADYTCIATYSVYKQIGKDEKGKMVSSLTLSTKIGPSYAYIDYKKPFLIDVRKISDL